MLFVCVNVLLDLILSGALPLICPLSLSPSTTIHITSVSWSSSWVEPVITVHFSRAARGVCVPTGLCNCACRQPTHHNFPFVFQMYDYPHVTTRALFLPLPQYLELLRSVQNRPAKCLTIMWALGQAGFYDLSQGLRGDFPPPPSPLYSCE